VANLAITRVKADFVGALVGSLCSLIVPASMWMIAVALVGTLLLCYVFSLDAGIRSSLVATINVILYQGQHL